MSTITIPPATAGVLAAIDDSGRIVELRVMVRPLQAGTPCTS
jgi:hypothetical protein